MKKYYVLDTNILLQNPNAIFGFEDNVVVITGTTLRSLILKRIWRVSLALMHVLRRGYWRISEAEEIF